MSGQYIVKKEIEINANPQQVWEALTNPDLTKHYFFGCKVFSDWKAGHDITFQRKFLWMRFQLSGMIIQAIPEKLLKYTLKNSGIGSAGNSSIVTDELTYVNGKTILKITDDVGAALGAEKRYKRSVKGWDKILKGLKHTVESQMVN